MRACTLAAAAARLNSLPQGAAPFRLAFMTDSARGPNAELIARILPRGAALILRNYGDARRAGLARRLRAITKVRGALLLIGADAGLARAVGADGVHLPRWADAPIDRAGLIITASAHDHAELERADRLGADLIILSPVYASNSHGGERALGPAAFKAMARAAPAPVLALGGIDETNAAFLKSQNVAGFAAIGAFAPSGVAA